MSRRGNPFRFLELLEELPALRVAELNRFGVFTTHSGLPVAINKSGINCVVIFSEALSILSVETKSNSKESIFIRIRKKRGNFGNLYYFVCGYTDRSVRALYFEGNGLVSRYACVAPYASRARGGHAAGFKAYRYANRLIGRDGRGPARGENRKQLAKKLFEDCQWLLREDPEVAAAVNSIVFRQAKKPLATRPRRYALDVGINATQAEHYVSPMIILGSIGDALSRALDGPQSSPSGQILDGPVHFIEETPRLCLREIAPLQFRPDEDGLRPMWATAFRLAPLDSAPIEVWLAIHQRGSREMAAIDLPDETADTQFVEIVRGAQTGSRRYFICPVLGKRCETLYFRDGRFASAKAQRLVHGSQRVWRPV